MPDNPAADETPRPKSSADMIRDAREAVGGKRDPDSSASNDLLRDSQAWIEDQTSEPDMPQTEGPTATDGSDRFEETDLVFAAPRPRRSRPLPATQTQPPTPGGVALPQIRRRSRATWLIAIAVIGVAVFTNMLAFLFNSGTEADVTVTEAPVTTQAQGFETTDRSEGTMTGEDPCTGEAIEGDVMAAIHYRETASTATVTVTITATDLRGADGSSYELEVIGSGGGTPGQQTFTFESSSMTMTRDDGRRFTDQATLVIEVVDKVIVQWGYTSVGATCDP